MALVSGYLAETAREEQIIAVIIEAMHEFEDSIERDDPEESLHYRRKHAVAAVILRNLLAHDLVTLPKRR